MSTIKVFTWSAAVCPVGALEGGTEGGVRAARSWWGGGGGTTGGLAQNLLSGATTGNFFLSESLVPTGSAEGTSDRLVQPVPCQPPANTCHNPTPLNRPNFSPHSAFKPQDS